jgi:hypothetical protein
MRVSRRRLLAVAASIPALLVARDGAQLLTAGARGAVAALRPPAQGTSATRCGLCGGTDHTMLDPRCPAAKRIA